MDRVRRVLIDAFLFLTTLPAFAQIDLSGVWINNLHEDMQDRIFGPELGDYTGIPLNAAARARAEAWDASLLTLPEYQCRVHPSDYAPSFADIRIWEEIDKDTQSLAAVHLHHFAFATERTIWMDGRPHPPDYALHTSMGFSTGKWDGDILTVTTTHLKIGWIRRNGIPRSDRAVVTEHFIRHGDRLTVVTVVDDPVYLTEPFLRSTDFVYDPTQQVDGYPCESVEEIVRPKGQIPHYLPGTNPYLAEFSDTHKIPALAAKGGAGTMYPEYRAKLTEPAKFTVDQQTGSQRRTPLATAPADDVQILPVNGSIYMLIAPSGNTTVEVGKEGVLLVDTQQ